MYVRCRPKKQYFAKNLERDLSSLHLQPGRLLSFPGDSSGVRHATLVISPEAAPVTLLPRPKNAIGTQGNERARSSRNINWVLCAENVPIRIFGTVVRTSPLINNPGVLDRVAYSAGKQ